MQHAPVVLLFYSNENDVSKIKIPIFPSFEANAEKGVELFVHLIHIKYLQY